MDRPIPKITVPKASPFDPWLWTMAWRDSRRSRRRLLLFMSSIVLGIAALVAINSFGDNLARSIDEQAKELVGADLVISSGSAFSPDMYKFLRGVGQTRSYETAFPSMIFFPKTQDTRLAQVKAVSGQFPYYGVWEATPAASVQAFREGIMAKRPVAMVDNALLTQFNIRPGDSVKVGNVTFLIVGRSVKIPGETAVTATVAPSVYIPQQLLPETGLLQRGSRATYRIHYLFNPGADVDQFAKSIEPKLDKAGISYDTVSERKRDTGRAFEDLTKFLNLVAFVALLLGCVGVASAVHLYVKEKLAPVAVLRCIGVSGKQAFLIYLIQTTIMGLLGALLGALLGSAVQLLLPEVFADFLPVKVSLAISWMSVWQGIGIGLLITTAFALLPLLVIRKISPLRTLRTSYEEDVTAHDPLQWSIYALIGLFIMGFAWLQTRDWKVALGFTLGLLVAFTVLTGLGRLLMVLVRKFFPVSWSYVWRQGLSNLYRPQNQTLILVISIGLGTFLMATLYLTQTLLLGRVQLSASGNQPNMVLFDIQTTQKAGVTQLVGQYKMPVIQNVPVVTMRLAAINGRSVEAIQKDTTADMPDWALTREYRVTYRDTLIGSEKVDQGKFYPMLLPNDTARSTSSGGRTSTSRLLNKPIRMVMPVTVAATASSGVTLGAKGASKTK